MSDKLASESAAVRYLSIHYEGYFMGRIATDPDPTNEPLGRSGYTVAFQDEDALDQTVRLRSWRNSHNLRAPADQMDGKRFPEVRVTGVTLDSVPVESALVNAPVNLLGKPGLAGPVLESRNNLVGSDDTFAFVVNPFVLRVGEGDQTLIATAAVNPANREEKIWEVTDPAIYKERFPVATSAGGDEVNNATGVYDYYEYFRARREWLQTQIDGAVHEERLLGFVDTEPGTQTLGTDELSAALRGTETLGYRQRSPEVLAAIRAEGAKDASCSGAGSAVNQLGVDLKEARAKTQLHGQQCRTRLFQLESWGDRVISKMGAQVNWDHFASGDQKKSTLRLLEAGGRRWEFDFARRWRCQYWFGGWDGDLLLGFHRGQLSVPVLPVKT